MLRIFSYTVGHLHIFFEETSVHLLWLFFKMMMLLKFCTQYASKFGKLSSAHRTGKCQFSFQSQRKAMPKNVKSKESERSEVTQSCPTLCDPMDYSLPGSSIHGIFQARVLEWVAISFSNAWDECNCTVVWAFFGIAFLGDWNENWPFPVLWSLLTYSKFAGILSSELSQHHYPGG